MSDPRVRMTDEGFAIVHPGHPAYDHVVSSERTYECEVCGTVHVDEDGNEWVADEGEDDDE